MQSTLRGVRIAAVIAAPLLGAACAGSSGSSIDGASTGQPATADTAPSSSQCAPCLSDSDCAFGVCAQFGGDLFCAETCPTGKECGAGDACTTTTTSAGDQVNACVPRTDPCGANVGPAADGGAGPAAKSQCGVLAPPSMSAACHSCGTRTCQANGCYGGWYCNTTTDKCQAPPTNCPAPDAGSGSGSDAGSGQGIDAGPPPPPGSIGNNGGTVSALNFAVVGDTRPPAIDDTSGYPKAVIDTIYTAIAARSPMPPFVVSTGDYVFAQANGTQAGPQLDMYLAARGHYPGVLFPAMGNHECTGAVTSNCGAGSTNGNTVNYTTFLSKLLTPIGKTSPNYVIHVGATDGSWTSKFVFIAGNAWTSSSATWLDTAMSESTTYTFIVRHEPAAASTAPGVHPSEQVMAKHPYTLAIVGHTHTYGKTGARQVTIGNGGAPLTGGANFGYGLITRRADGAIQIDMIDYQSGQPDTSFRFALKADGSPAP